MSERERASVLLEAVPEYKLQLVIAYLQGLTDGVNDIPNDETLEAMESAENGEDMYGPFDSVADMMESLNA